MQKDPDKYRSVISSFQERPVEEFFHNVLQTEPWGKQVEIIESVRDHQRTSVKSCHGIGKTYIAARVALWFLTSHPDSIVITTAPTFRQVENQIWRELHEAYDKSNLQLGGKLNKTLLEYGAKWYAMGVSSKEPTNVQGYHADDILIIVDEAAGVAPPILEAIEGSLTSARVRLLYIGNPTISYGGFYDSHLSPLYNKISIPVYCTPNFVHNGIRSVSDLERFTSQEEVAALPILNPSLVTPLWAWQRLQAWGKTSPMFRARVEAIFPEENKDTLIPLNYINFALEREWTLRELREQDTTQAIGIDVARFGDDVTVLTHVQGNRHKDTDWFNGKDTMQTVGKATEMFNAKKMNKDTDMFVVDDTGVGGGVSDRLTELGYRVIRVNFAQRAQTEEFANAKAEMFWHLRDLFLSENISILDHGKLIAQLSTIRYNMTSNQKIEIVSKQKMKKIGLDSPDFADSLALAFYGIRFGESVISDPDDDDEYDNEASYAGNLKNKSF